MAIGISTFLLVFVTFVPCAAGSGLGFAWHFVLESCLPMSQPNPEVSDLFGSVVS